jgi:hypothetical protein
MKSHRFSKKSLIDRYFKNKHGYALMGTLFVSIYSFFDGPYDISGWNSLGYRQLANTLTPIFGGHSYSALFFIFSVLLIFYIELVVFNPKENKGGQK